MDVRKIKKLMELFEESSIAEIEITEDGESVRLKKHSQEVSPSQQTMLTTDNTSMRSITNTQKKQKPEQKSSPSSEITIKSPMLGTVYLSSTPGEPPFVEIGDSIKKGDTLCVIEAMKMFNPIESDHDGIVSARLIRNGDPVEFDQPLFVIDQE